MTFKSAILAGALILLAGCGHGYEGEYRAEGGSENQFIDAVAKIIGDQTLVIGKNYLDSNGERTEFADIFVRESGSQSYLVFKKADGSEEAWKIVDQDTLERGGDLVSIRMKRVKS
ncbi:hypothetical protein [Methylomonas sp. UP202]|uniref:hypothetical protein n=1 Tax=Methylomonas sp. UP202 TaxID=3040943 RepID=UPI002478B4D8|nr:hypothetical protein [Methylomonas sp. UP202]WGS84149.1 hypothetical protein QC632_13920 [Methylomonas sp. UP202]